MSNPKFTPGPWKIWGDWAITDCTPAENRLAQFEQIDQKPEQTSGNAFLIAAAPEMYELLCQMLPHCDHDEFGDEVYLDGVEYGDFHWEDLDDPMIDKLRKLLAKARGE